VTHCLVGLNAFCCVRSPFACLGGPCAVALLPHTLAVPAGLPVAPTPRSCPVARCRLPFCRTHTFGRYLPFPIRLLRLLPQLYTAAPVAGLPRLLTPHYAAAALYTTRMNRDASLQIPHHTRWIRIYLPVIAVDALRYLVLPGGIARFTFYLRPLRGGYLDLPAAVTRCPFTCITCLPGFCLYLHCAPLPDYLAVDGFAVIGFGARWIVDCHGTFACTRGRVAAPCPTITTCCYCNCLLRCVLLPPLPYTAVRFATI